MSFKFTLVLLAVAIVAIAGFGLAQRQSPPPAAAPGATPTPVIMDLEPVTVTNLDVQAAGKETSLTKDGDKWTLVKPEQDPNVDQTKVSRVVGSVALLTGSRSVAKPGEDITPYGLRNPQIKATVSGAGKTETLLVGDKNVNGNEYYAMRQEGSDVTLVPSSVVTPLLDLVNNPPRASPAPSTTASAPASASPSS